MYGQPHERLFLLPVSVLFRVGSAGKTAKRSETVIDPGSRDPESNVLDRSAMVATQSLTCGTCNVVLDAEKHILFEFTCTINSEKHNSHICS